MVAEDAGRVQVQLRLFEVLVEIAAAGDVEDLKAATDAQHGDAGVERLAGEGELELVAGAAVVGRPRVRLLPVGRRDRGRRRR